ncbi:unnamed protein product, partial [Polarella glacialis]
RGSRSSACGRSAGLRTRKPSASLASPRPPISCMSGAARLASLRQEARLLTRLRIATWRDESSRKRTTSWLCRAGLRVRGQVTAAPRYLQLIGSRDLARQIGVAKEETAAQLGIARAMRETDDFSPFDTEETQGESGAGSAPDSRGAQVPFLSTAPLAFRIRKSVDFHEVGGAAFHPTETVVTPALKCWVQHLVDVRIQELRRRQLEDGDRLKAEMSALRRLQVEASSQQRQGAEELFATAASLVDAHRDLHSLQRAQATAASSRRTAEGQLGAGQKLLSNRLD